MEQFNTIILGFGKAGKTLAGYLAGKGLKVAVIEKMKECMAEHVLMLDVFQLNF